MGVKVKPFDLVHVMIQCEALSSADVSSWMTQTNSVGLSQLRSVELSE